MEYTIFTHANGNRFAQLPNGQLIPNQGTYKAGEEVTDEQIAANFAEWKRRKSLTIEEFMAENGLS